MRTTTLPALVAVLLCGAALAQPDPQGLLAQPQPGQPAQGQVQPQPGQPPQAQAQPQPGQPPQAQGQPRPGDPPQDAAGGESEEAVEGDASDDRPRPQLVVEDVLRQVSETTGRQFLVDPRVPPLLYGFGTVEPPYDYTALLAILRNNSFMAIEIDGYVSIVPDQLARQFPTRIVQDDDPSIGSDEWVTRILAVSENVNAVQLVPVMRPMQPQSAHLSAIASLNSLIIVDRYANVQRITEVVRMLEQRAAENGAAR